MTNWKRSGAGLALALTLLACGEDEKKEPKSEDTGCNFDGDACEEGLLCEQVGSGEDNFKCLPPVIVAGRVYDAVSDEGLADATIVGLNVDGAARTRVARSGADGTYQLPVSMRRNEDGSPAEDESITLRVAAADHQPFPTAPRTALPIALTSAEQVSTADAGTVDAGADSLPVWRVQNAATDVALVELPADQRGGATVEGTVKADEPGGVLVLAVAGDKASASAISDLDGAFVLFNVPAGNTSVEGYKAGLSLASASVDVPAAGLSDVELADGMDKLSSVSGSINIVNATGGLTSSVILVVASTFDTDAVRGEAPAGMRATDVSNAFSIEGVPPGRYAVLAAFGNDGLVRDPDQSIAGTDVVFVDVGAEGGTVNLDQSFKVTGALDVVSPGAGGVEQVSAGDLTLSWADDSSEDGYELRVYDALGNVVHEDAAIGGVSGSATVEYTLDASSFQSGMLYQFRVWSWRDHKGARTYISATEDLKGVFEIM